MLKFFSMSAVLIGTIFISNAYANTHEIVCWPHTTILEKNFEQNWEQLPNNNYYSSIVKINDFLGALHTTIDQLPVDKNPHLRFNSISVQHVKHYGAWYIACRYDIGNPLMQDMPDGYLHMTMRVLDGDYRCKKLNNFMARCKKK